METGMIIMSLVMMGLGIVSVLGLILWLVIRYAWKDRALAKNILNTVIVIALIPVVYRSMMFNGALITTVLYHREQIQLITLRGLFAEGLERMAETLIFMLPMLGIGFLIAFLVVVPITLLSRRVRR